jgi:hypothetical protein
MRKNNEATLTMKRSTTAVTDTAKVDIVDDWLSRGRLGGRNLSMTGGRVSERIKTQRRSSENGKTQDDQTRMHEKAEKV